MDQTSQNYENSSVFSLRKSRVKGNLNITSLNGFSVQLAISILFTAVKPAVGWVKVVRAPLKLITRNYLVMLFGKFLNVFQLILKFLVTEFEWFGNL